jgi:hypothetical protein
VRVARALVRERQRAVLARVWLDALKRGGTGAWNWPIA